MRFYIVIFLLFLIDFQLVNAQSNNNLSFHKLTGIGFNKTMPVDTVMNKLFHQLTKTNAPAHKIGLPFIGDFHFNDYPFVEASSDVFRYNYFFVTGDVFPSLFLFDNESSSANIRITFGLKIRVWNYRRPAFRTNYRPSHALKTPSYLPGIFYSRLIKSKLKGNVKQLHYLEVGYSHHSNGQDGPPLIANDSTLYIPGNLKYNIDDGDFSANNLSLGYYINKVDQFNYKQSHCIKMIFDGMDSPEFKEFDLHKYKLLYSFHHGIISKTKFSNPSFSEKHRLGFEIGFGVRNFNDVSFSRSVTFKLNYNRRIDILKKVYLLIEYNYLGQDDYNIYLEHSIHHFRIGFSNFVSMEY